MSEQEKQPYAIAVGNRIYRVELSKDDAKRIRRELKEAVRGVRVFKEVG